MSKLWQSAALFLFLAACAPAASAQTATPPNPDDEVAKADLINRSPRPRMPRTPAERRAVYEMGKEYLRKYGQPEDEVVGYVRRWVLKYEAEMRALDRSLRALRQAGARAVCRLRPERGLE